MKPPSSSARMRRKHGGAEMPTRRASSTLVIRPSSCNSLRIFRSIKSSRSATAASVNHLPHPYSHWRFRETLLRSDGIGVGELAASGHDPVASDLQVLHGSDDLLNCALHNGARAGPRIGG